MNVFLNNWRRLRSLGGAAHAATNMFETSRRFVLTYDTGAHHCCIYIYMYIHIYAFKYMYIYIYVYTYTHTISYYT